jgi:DNA repair exonuclease SbcCD ATPase subunit
MDNVYRPLRGVVQETLHLSKTNSMVLARVKGSDAASLNDAIEELEKTLVDRIGRLKAVIRDKQAAVEGEAEYTEQVTEILRANIAALEAKLRESEDAVNRKDVASQKMEETLSLTIRDLQSAVKEKEEALESRVSEVNDLKSQLTHLELAVRQAKEEVASEAQRAEDLTESFKGKIATLEAQLRQAEQTVRGKDWTLQNLTAKIQDLETQLRDKEELLEDRDRQVTGLNAELKRLTNGIKEKSSFFREAEALDVQAPAIDTVVAGAQLTTGEEKPAASSSHDVGVTSHVMDAARETVAGDAFDRMIGELGEFTNIMDSMASLIVRNHVKALGESMENFPKTRLAELIDKLSQEISDEKLRTGFRERLGRL